MNKLGSNSPDPLKPFTSEWEKRQKRHFHNSLTGCAAMTKQFCRKVIDASSTTAGAKQLAVQIQRLTDELDKELRAHRIGC